jgi:DNA repair exonuclease SbcCD ATPase subunit
MQRSLAGIIESRSKKALQLVIITHDEEFVTELGRALGEGGGSSSKGQLGTFYRVSRSQVRPGVFHSRISLQEFAS